MRAQNWQQRLRYLSLQLLLAPVVLLLGPHRWMSCWMKDWLVIFSPNITFGYLKIFPTSIRVCNHEIGLVCDLFLHVSAFPIHAFFAIVIVKTWLRLCVFLCICFCVFRLAAHIWQWIICLSKQQRTCRQKI